MRFDTYIPSDILKPYIRILAISEAKDEQTYKVLPDTAAVMGFQYRGKLQYLENEKETQLSSSGITGLMDHYRVFKNSANTGTVLVYFKEAGAAAFFRQPVHELFGRSVSLDNFMLRSELLLLEEQLQEAGTDAERIHATEQFLISRLKFREPDSLVLAALTHIHKNQGNIRITDLAKQLNISQSPLEKRFRQVVGTSPKKYASILRLKLLIQSYSRQSTLTETGYGAGFYDQSHFIKEFKRFTGETPEIFFSRE